MEQALEIAGTLVGLLYLWFEYRASIYLWVASVVMPAIYLFVYYEAGLYADFGINVYYLLAALYGWITWRYGIARHRGKSREKTSHPKAAGDPLPISKIPRRYLLPATIAFGIAFGGIAWILIRFTNSDVPWLDSFTTALSIVGMWMLARKYVEQWWVWIGVDVVSVGLYLYKGLYFTAALYTFYAIIAIFGYLRWEKIRKSNHANE